MTKTKAWDMPKKKMEKDETQNDCHCITKQSIKAIGVYVK